MLRTAHENTQSTFLYSSWDELSTLRICRVRSTFSLAEAWHCNSARRIHKDYRNWKNLLSRPRLRTRHRQLGRVLVLVVVKRQERSSQASLVASAFRTTILIRVNLNFRLRQARLTPTTTQVATDDTKVRSNLPRSTTCQSRSALRHRDYHAEDLADLHTAEQRDGTLDASAAIDIFSIRSVCPLDNGFSAWMVWWQRRRRWGATLKIQRLTMTNRSSLLFYRNHGVSIHCPLGNHSQY